MTPLDKVKLGVALLLDGQVELAVAVRELVARGELVSPAFDDAMTDLGVALDVIDALYAAQATRMSEVNGLFELVMTAIAQERAATHERKPLRSRVH